MSAAIAMDRNTLVRRLVRDPDLPRPGRGWQDFEVEALWPATAPVPVRVRAGADTALEVHRSFVRGSLVCVVARASVEPTGSAGQQRCHHLVADRITGIRPPLSTCGAAPPAGWAKVTASGWIHSEELGVRLAGAGRNTGEFVLSTHQARVRRSALLMVRARIEATGQLCESDLVSVTGTLAVDTDPDGAPDVSRLHVDADRIEVMSTARHHERLRPVPASVARHDTVRVRLDRYRTVDHHHPPVVSEGLGL